MKLFFVPLLLVLNQSIAQSNDADTTHFIVDKCKIRGASFVLGTIVKDQPIIQTGSPANQESSPSNDSIQVRGGKGDSTYYYIDGIKVRGISNLPKSAAEEVTVITGGLPVNYGDSYCGCIIRINCPPKTPAVISDKVQNLPTE